MHYQVTTPGRAGPAPAGHAAGEFRADIEGLRGVCVGAVVLYHAFPAWLPGGFIGVDVFFVISGFLITSLLLREIEASGGVNLAQFWARRIRRILPAATLVLVAIALAACLVAATDARLIGRHIAAAALFYYNWRQVREAVDYRGSDDADNPVLHYWSLAVEEQFYLVWPLLLALAVAAFGAHRSRLFGVLALVIGALFAGSLALSIHLTTANEPLAFFSTFTRSWQLLAGAAAALIVARGGGGRVARLVGRGPIALVCLGALAASFALVTEGVPYPGVVALVPTLAAAVLLATDASGTRAGTLLLGNAPLRYVGRISYSWYLWHWPVLVFGMLLFGAEANYQWAAIALSFALAAASYALVEQPVRHSARLRTSLAATYLLGAALVATGAGAGLLLRSVGPDAVAIGGGRFVSAQAIRYDRPQIYRDGCLLEFEQVASPACMYGAATGAKTVVLFGDSHAGNWFPALEAAAKAKGWRLVMRVKASCRPADAPQVRKDGTPYPECATWRGAVLTELAELKPDLIIVAGLTEHIPVDAEARTLATLGALAPTIAMRDTPALPEPAAACLKRAGPEGCTWPLAARLAEDGYPKVAPEAMPANVTVLDLNHRVCPEGTCRAVTNGRVLMSDRHHLTESFGATLADAFEAVLAGR